ncbi:MAG: glycosyltransferase family 4 protein [Chitinophagaceae bacterium]
MKILHVCSNYYPAKGGPQYVMKHLSENLAKYYNDEVEVITTDSLYGPELKIYKKIKPTSEIINDVKIKRLPFIRWQYPLLNFFNKVSAKVRKKSLPHFLLKHRWQLNSPAINNEMKKTSAHVIMVTTASYMFADYPLWRFKTKNAKPFILYGAIHFKKKADLNSVFINRAKACDLYVANTTFEEKKLIALGVSPHKIATIGIGIEPQEFNCIKKEYFFLRHKYNVGDDEILIAHVGRLSKGKGIFLLTEAFEKLYENNKAIKLLLAGTTTEDVLKIKKIIFAKNLPVIVLEDFDESNKPLIFNALDIFVLASQGESFGVVFLEAWACRKPVIGADLGAIASLIDNNKNGFLFETDNVKSLAEKLNLLIQNKMLREEFGNNGYKKATSEYNWKTITEKYKNAYLKTIENFKNEYSTV